MKVTQVVFTYLSEVVKTFTTILVIPTMFITKSISDFHSVLPHIIEQAKVHCCITLIVFVIFLLCYHQYDNM